MLKRAIKHYTGYSFLRWKLRPKGVYVFNYHRVGDAENAQFDPNLYSCTAEDFRTQLRFYRENFQLIDLAALNELVKAGKPLDDRYALITFDDGYADNFNLAYPELKSQGASAVFFVVIDYADKQPLPWWDQVAWLVRSSDAASVKLDHWDSPIQIAGVSPKQSIRSILRHIKSDADRSIADNVAMLQQTLLGDREPPTLQEKPFMSWDEIREMHEGGMDIGSHTCSHRVLSHLSDEEQEHELRASKARLEEELGATVSSLAYPVGGPTAFNDSSVRLAHEAGYSVAFSFMHGINTTLGNDQIHRLLRMPVDDGMRLRHIKQSV